MVMIMERKMMEAKKNPAWVISVNQLGPYFNDFKIRVSIAMIISNPIFFIICAKAFKLKLCSNIKNTIFDVTNL